MGNPEPVFVTRGLVLGAEPRIIKEKHVCLQLKNPDTKTTLSAMGWSRAGQTPWPGRIATCNLGTGSVIDLVYRLRKNEHPTYGGLELDMLDFAVSASQPIMNPVSHLHLN
jgi:single-stranded-DNA-specific exonuclease